MLTNFAHVFLPLLFLTQSPLRYLHRSFRSLTFRLLETVAPLVVRQLAILE